MDDNDITSKQTTKKKAKTIKAADSEGKNEAVKDAEEKAKQAMTSETLRKSAKRTSRLKEVSQSRKIVEGKTRTTQFEKQRAHKGSEELEDALIKHSKGKGKDKEGKRISAKGKVEDTLKLDVDKLKDDNLGTNLAELDTELDEATRHRNNKGEIIADSMKTRDRSDQEKTAQNFEDAVDDMEDDLKEEVAERVEDASPERAQKAPKTATDEPTSSVEDDIVEAIEDVVDHEIQKNEGKVA